MNVQLQGVQIKAIFESEVKLINENDNLREVLEQYPLWFCFYNGKVLKIFPQKNESTWALNIKRGILSALQTSSLTAAANNSVEEVDISGKCPTQYQQKGTLLLKMKDFNLCSHHFSGFTALRSVALPNALEQLLSSKLECLQRFEEKGILEEVKCIESHLVTPPARKGNGVKMQTRTVLKLFLTEADAGSREKVATSDIYESSLLYEKEKTAPLSQEEEVKVVADVLQRLCMKPTKDPEPTDIFLNLVFALRQVSTDALMDLWQRPSSKCRGNWQPLLDALPFCATEPCVVLMKKLIIFQEVEDDHIERFLRSLAFIPEPTAGMIDALAPLLELPRERQITFLGLTSLLHHFCSSRTSCEQVPAVLRVMKILGRHLGRKCTGSKLEETPQMELILNAIGNAGLAATSLTTLLSSCAVLKSNPTEIRLAAIEAFRRIPCAANRAVLVHLFQTYDENVEIRIASYLMAMKCPSKDLFNHIKWTLQEEKSSQVGSFVWSHLSELLKTEDPLKQHLRNSLPEDIISKEFDWEAWKFSSYTDITFHSAMASGNAEAKIIFSPASFIPRLILTNFTIHLLGRALNLLEVGVRFENMEDVVRTFFDFYPVQDTKGRHTKPESPIEMVSKVPLNKPSSKQFSLKNHLPKENKTTLRTEKLSCPRGQYHKLNEFVKKFTKKMGKKQKPKCKLNIKIFGNELVILDCGNLRSQAKHYYLNLAELMMKVLKGQEVQWIKRLSLATEEVLFPTISGLPVLLGFNASAAVNLTARGDTDFKKHNHFFINGYLKPSFILQISAQMGTVGVLGKTGLNWSTVLRSSTNLDGGIRVKKRKEFKFFWNTPEEAMEVVHFSSKLYVTAREETKPVDHFPGQAQLCTAEEVSKTFGWQLCSEVFLPDDKTSSFIFPFPGPAKVAIMLKKQDRSLQQYLIKAAYNFVAQKGSWIPNEAGLHFFMGTPKSELKRDVAFEFHWNISQKKIRIEFIKPKTKIQVNGKIEISKYSRVGHLELIVNDNTIYYIKGRTDLQSVAREPRYAIRLEAKLLRHGSPIILAGNITKQANQKMALSVSLINLLKDAAFFSVCLEKKADNDLKHYSLEGETHIPGVLGSHMILILQQRGQFWSNILRIKYGLFEDAKKLRHECNMAQKLKLENSLPDTYRLDLEHEFHCTQSLAYNHKFTVQVPERNLDYRTQLLHSRSFHHYLESSTSFKVHYNNHIPFIADLQWKNISRRLLKWEGTFNMDTPWLYLYATHKFHQFQRSAYFATVELTVGKAFVLKGLVLEFYGKDNDDEKESRIEIRTSTTTYLRASTINRFMKGFLHSRNEIMSLWSQLIKHEVLLESSEQTKFLHFRLTSAKKEFNLTASYCHLEVPRKSNISTSVLWTDHKNPPLALRFEAQIEEVKKEKVLYQKRGSLLFRHPLNLPIPQSFLLQGTFTVNKKEKHYSLETKVVINGLEDSIQTITLGYLTKNPYICARLTHPYNSNVFPKNTEACIMVRNLTHANQELEAKLKINQEEVLHFLGRYQNKSSVAQSHHLIQLDITHSFQAQASLNWHGWNGLNGSFDLHTSGWNLVFLEANFNNQMRKNVQAIHVSAALNQEILDRFKYVQLQFLSKVTPSRLLLSSSVKLSQHFFHVGISGSKEHKAGLVVTLHGHVQHNLESLWLIVPQDLSLNSSLKHRINLSEGLVSIAVNQSVLAMRVRSRCFCGNESFYNLMIAVTQNGRDTFLAQGKLKGSLEFKQRTQRDEAHVQMDADPLCVGFANVFLRNEVGFTGTFTHNISSFHATGLPTESSIRALYGHNDTYQTVALDLQGGNQKVSVTFGVEKLHPEALQTQFTALVNHSIAELKKQGLPSRVQWICYYQNFSSKSAMGTRIQAGEEELKMMLENKRTNSTARFSLFLHHNVKLLLYIIPPGIQATLRTLLHGSDVGNHCAPNIMREILSNSTFAPFRIHAACNLEYILEISFSHAWPYLKSLGLTQENKVKVAIVSGDPHTGLLEITLGNRTLMANGALSAEDGGTAAEWRVTFLNKSGTLENPALPQNLVSGGSVFIKTHNASLTMFFQCNGTAADMQLEIDKYVVRGTLNHSLSYLQDLGLPRNNLILLTMPSNSDVEGLLLLHVGSCKLEEHGIPSHSHLTGSLLKDGCQVEFFNALQVEDQGAYFTVRTKCQPKFTLEVELRHGLPFFNRIPKDNKLTVHCGKRLRRAVSLELKSGLCRLQANLEMDAENRSQWQAVMENTCKMIQTRQELHVFLDQHSKGAINFGIPARIEVDLISEKSGALCKRLLQFKVDGKQITEELVFIQKPDHVFLGYKFKHNLETLQRLWIQDKIELQLMLLDSLSENETEASLNLAWDPDLRLSFIFIFQKKLERYEMQFLPGHLVATTVYQKIKRQMQELRCTVSWDSKEIKVISNYTGLFPKVSGNHDLNVKICHPFSGPFPPCSSLNVNIEHSLRNHQDRIIISWDEKEQVLVSSSLKLGRARVAYSATAAHPFNFTMKHIEVSSLTEGRQGAYTQQLKNILTIASLQACGSLKQTAALLNQHLDLTWDSKTVAQQLTYEKSKVLYRDKMLVQATLTNLLTACSHQHILGKVETDYSAWLNYDMQFGMCGLPNAIALSGKLQLNQGDAVLRSEGKISLADNEGAILVALRNDSKLEMKNYSVELSLKGPEAVWMDVKACVTSSADQSQVLVEGKMDHPNEKVKITAFKGKGCLRYYMGYLKGNSEDGLEFAACMEGQKHAALNAHLIVNRRQEVGYLTMEASNQSLNLKAHGCWDLVMKTEVQHIEFLYVAIGWSLEASQEIVRFLHSGMGTVAQMWEQSGFKHLLQDHIPLYLRKLQSILQQIQLELQKPLTTLKDAYYDVTLKPLDEVWQQKTDVYLKKLQALVPTVVKDVWLMEPIQVALRSLKTGFDMATQQILNWAEAKLSRMLSKLQKSLSNLYRFSARNCTVAVSLPVLPKGEPTLDLVNITNYIIEEKLMKPLRGLYNINLGAEYYKFKRAIMESPFEHHALLMGTKHLWTFDGKMYSLTSNCSMLLAKDFAHDAFSVVLNQRSSAGRSLYLSMNKTALIIYPEEKIYRQYNISLLEDCGSFDIPPQENGITIQVETKHVEVTAANGALIFCDLRYNFCTLTLDGWHHGASAGLFGTNDNEAGNEWMLPDRSLAKSLSEFIQAWEVNDRCGEVRKNDRPCRNTQSSEICKTFFQDSTSSLRNCFGVVNPEPFYHWCRTDVCELHSIKPACNLAAAFGHLCSRNFVPVEMPLQCETAK
ncbi:uncharacterized protein LOC134505396 [Candoia aspera]|uniref:uncharacterized protein LOC134505396 n=1 Tax=Candoia aspera TaxID=51853 RepID=UPI002FD7D71A